MLCDEHGKVCICATCGQIHSPYWTAQKSAHLHSQTGHLIQVLPANEVLRYGYPGVPMKVAR